MLSSSIPSPALIAQAPTEVRDYLLHLQSENAQLSAEREQLANIVSYDDPGEAVDFLAALSSAIVAHFGTEDAAYDSTRTHKSALLADHLERMGQGMRNRALRKASIQAA